MADAADKASGERSPEEIEREIERTRAELADTVAQVADKADVKKQAKAKVEEKKTEAKAKVEETKTQAKAKVEETTTQARANPAPAIAGAVALVLLLIWLLRR